MDPNLDLQASLVAFFEVVTSSFLWEKFLKEV